MNAFFETRYLLTHIEPSGEYVEGFRIRLCYDFAQVTARVGMQSRAGPRLHGSTDNLSGDERAVATTPHIHASTRLIHPFSTMGIWGMRVNLSKPCKRPARVGRGSYEAW